MNCSFLTMFRIFLTGFSSSVHYAHAVCMHCQWCWFIWWKHWSLDLLFLLKAFLTFSWQFQWSNNSINPHLSCAVSIALLAVKQTTCFTTNIFFEKWVWHPRELELWLLPKDTTRVMLHLPVFVENANKPEFAFLQWTVICWILSQYMIIIVEICLH